MRSIITIVIAALLLFYNDASALSGPGFSIKGKIIGKTTGMIYLYHTYQEKEFIDSCSLTNGDFEFKGTAPGPYLYRLGIPNNRYRPPFFIENKKLNITVDSSMTTIEVSGSKSHKLFEEFLELYMRMHLPAGEAYNKINQAAKDKDSLAEAMGVAELTAIGVAHDLEVEAYVKKYPDSELAPYVINERYIVFPKPELVKKLYPLLKKKARNSVYGKMVQQYFDEQSRSNMGTQLEFSMADTAGNKINLSDFKGKYVLIDFWASWCGPCRKENPNIVAAYNKYKEKGFDILGISLDSKKDAWMAAIKKDALTWAHASELNGWSNSLIKYFGIKSVPANILVDKNGKVVAKDLREEALHKKLEELLN